MNLYKNIQKLQKPLRKIKEEIQAKLLFEPIRKTQRQCKTRAGLERNHRKSPEQKSVSTNYTWNGIISDKNTIAEEFNTFLTNIGPNLSKKIPQISKTFDQHFSPVYTQINHQDLTLKVH